jgi:hypothetical protein
MARGTSTRSTPARVRRLGAERSPASGSMRGSLAGRRAPALRSRSFGALCEVTEPRRASPPRCSPHACSGQSGLGWCTHRSRCRCPTRVRPGLPSICSRTGHGWLSPDTRSACRGPAAAPRFARSARSRAHGGSRAGRASRSRIRAGASLCSGPTRRVVRLRQRISPVSKSKCQASPTKTPDRRDEVSFPATFHELSIDKRNRCRLVTRNSYYESRRVYEINACSSPTRRR